MCTSAVFWVAVLGKRPTQGQCRLVRPRGWKDLAEEGWRARRWIHLKKLWTAPIVDATWVPRILASGIADVDAPPTIVDALEEDLATQTDVAGIHSVEIAPTQLDTREGTFVPPSRRLVLIGGGSASQNRVNSLVETPVPGPEVFAMSGSDTESFGSVSSGGNSTVEVVESESDGEEEGSIPIHSVPGTHASRTGLESLDAVDLLEVWKVRPTLMQSVPRFLRGAYRAALRQALDIISVGEERGDQSLQTRGWKLFFLSPRMFLHRPPPGGIVSKKKLKDRASLFCSGQWDIMVEESLVSAVNSTLARSRRRRRDARDTVEKRARRAFHMVQLGELSAARQALEGAAVAPGNKTTLSALKDPTKRPPSPRQAVPDHIRHFSPDEEFDLDVDLFLKNVRTARRGAAPGPSGMTADHVRVLLDNDADGAVFGHVATLLARSRVPAEILQAIRSGKVIALQKPDGGVRGIVVGDTLRRMVARTMAQQLSAQVEVATSPHQYALKNKAGCETVAHILQVLTELDEEATVVSVDGIGAFDLISRNAMMSGLRFMVDGDRVLPFVRAFYGQPLQLFVGGRRG